MSLVAGAGETLGRINLRGTGNITGGDPILYTGADNISVYAQGSSDPVPVPEPGTLLLLGTGLVAARYRRRRR